MGVVEALGLRCAGALVDGGWGGGDVGGRAVERRIGERLGALGDRKRQLDQDIVARALRKRQQQQSLTRSERGQLSRWEAIREEEQWWDVCRRVRQMWFKVLSGRQTKTLHDHAERYGLPLGGEIVDLAELVPAWFDFIRDNARKLAGVDDEDPLLAGASSPALEQYRSERAKIAKLERLEMERTLVPREQVHDGLARLAARLRGAGESLQRQFGPEALAILDEALADFDREVTASFE